MIRSIVSQVRQRAIAVDAMSRVRVRARVKVSASVGAVNPCMQGKGQQQSKGQGGKHSSAMGQRQEKGSVTCFSWAKRAIKYAKTDSCPAKNAECSFCHKNGHWAGCCHTKQKSKIAGTEHKGVSAKKIELDTKAIILGMSIEQPNHFTVRVLDSKGTPYSLTAEVDFGSYCFAISHDF